MESVSLKAVPRHGMSSRLAHLMHVAARTPVGIVAPVRAQDAASVPRPALSCVVLPWADVEKAGETHGLKLEVARPNLSELQHNWKCEYLGHDTGATAEPPRYSVTVFKPPRGRTIAFVSRACFAAVHPLAEVRIIEVAFDDLTRPA